MTLTPARGIPDLTTELIPDLTTEGPQQYSASKFFTKQYVESIKFQSEIMNTNELWVEELKKDTQDREHKVQNREHRCILQP